jgi:outer membrane protein OmpA-like peptidoglycan-associated protein/tetratricopeptide (TPR) repeat protein
LTVYKPKVMQQFRKAYILSLVLLFSLQYLQAQDQDKVQSQQYYELAKEMIKATRAVDDARDLMVIAANFDTTNVKANFETGYMYITTINKDLAEKYFNRVYRQQPAYRFDLEYWIGRSYQYGLQFDKALDFYGRYKTRLEKTSTNYSGKDKVSDKELARRIEECINGKEFVAQPKALSINNLGSEINSEYDDYGPVVNSEETEIIFTTRRRDGNTNENVSDDNKPYEDIFISKKTGGKWEQAKNIGTSVNTRFNNSNLTLSPNGNTLFIYKDGVGEGDIFFSERQPDGSWTISKPLPGTINSPYRESSVSITNDESTIYFASERPGGLGVSDIYSAKKNSKGSWSIIKNLGPSVNTDYEEDSPYIDYDGKTLYFSSMGRKGMGGHDLFKTTLIDAETNQWSEPENMGYPVNTPDDDVFITGTSTPNRFYFASGRSGGFGYSDIYLVTDEVNKDEVKNEPVKKETQIHKFILTVLDAETNQPIEAKVRMKGIDNSFVGGLNMVEGVFEFLIMSPISKDYIVRVEKDGYIFENLELTLGGTTEAETKEEKTIVLRKVKTGEVSILRHVFFDTGKAILKDNSFDELEQLLLMLQYNTKLNVEISGHTDDVGSPELNMELSKKRALAVRNYLTSNGIEPKRVTAVGHGETRPIVSNDDEESGRAINRRVEFKVLQN